MRKAGARVDFPDLILVSAEATATPDISFKPLQPPVPFNVYAIHLWNRPPSKLATVLLKHLKSAFPAYRKFL